MVSILLSFLVAILVLAILWYVLRLVGLPEPITTIVMLVALLLVILFLFRGHAF